ncbi:MAG: hypothetical protein LC790_07760 [Actinobacteria bacterium]|nr:hypothetical protein [Actinomycetota bacterium]
MKSTNGAIERQRERVSAAANVVNDEQTLAAEQTLAETDQTLADADQTSSDSDQVSADGDQVAADDDQVASDRDLAHGATGSPTRRAATVVSAARTSAS